MRPRHASDYRTLLWAFVFFPAAPALAYAWPAALPWALVVGFYLSYCSGVLTHNHTHVPVFAGAGANRFYSAWLSVFYGCPVAFWIPTHQLNHHRFVNGSSDVTRTYRRSNEHDAWQAFMYSITCALWQRPLIASYVRRARERGALRWHELREQSIALLGAHLGMLALALELHGIGRGLFVYALGFGLPALLAPTFMMFTNYIQHVHCEPGSPHHSRDFTSRFTNWFVFDAGYHTVHHEHPTTHWSNYARMHRERVPAQHPSLEEHSIARFCFKNYVLGPLWPAFRTRPLAAANAE
jgi:beta-carotene hydroxylase